MLKEAINGVCMAIADSVSGGTIAFIMGFYDKFIGSINNIVFGNKEKKKDALKYLVKLGTWWILGMMLGSFYAIIMGPTTLDVPQAAISISNFNIIACVIGLCIVVGLQKLKKYGEYKNKYISKYVKKWYNINIMKYFV